MLLGAYTRVSQNRRTQGCTQGSRLPRFRRPVVAASTHMCVAEYVRSGLHPTSKGYKGLADQVLLRAYTRVLLQTGLHPGVEILPGLRRSTANCCCEHTHTHVCVADWVTLEGCSQGSRVTQVPPTSCCCEHTHTCVLQKTGADVTRVRPTRCCCRNTHVC